MNIIFFIILNDLLFNDHIAYASVEQKGANQDFIRIICNDTLLLSKERLSMKIVNTYFKKNDIEIFYKSNIFLVIYYLFFKIPNEHDNCLIDDIRCHIIFSIFLFQLSYFFYHFINTKYSRQSINTDLINSNSVYGSQLVDYNSTNDRYMQKMQFPIIEFRRSRYPHILFFHPQSQPVESLENNNLYVYLIFCM